MRPWRWFVYELLDGGECVYVGKGSGRRLKHQMRNRGLDGREIARFKRESEALRFEVALIAERTPSLNKDRGGTGPRSRKRQHRLTKIEREMQRLGSRRYVARELLKFDLRGNVSESQLETLRKAAA